MDGVRSRRLKLDAAARLGGIRPSSEERDVFPREIQSLCRNATGRQTIQPTHANASSVIQGYTYAEKARIRASDICIISLWTLIKNIQVARHGF